MNTHAQAQRAVPRAQSVTESECEARYVLAPRVTAKEIAAVAGTTIETVLRAHRQGSLKSGVRLGRSLTFEASEVVRWLHAQGLRNVVAISKEVRG